MLSKKKVITATIAGALCGYLAFSQETYVFFFEKALAAGDTKPDQLWNTTFHIVTLIQYILAAIFFRILHLMEVLLDPNFFIDIFKNKQEVNPLNLLWRFSRDIVNVVLAFILITGAAMAIVMPHKKEVITSAIPKFILAVVLVNFSWFFPRVILDTANVLTASIYTAPAAFGIECKVNDQPCKIWSDLIYPEKPEEFDGKNGYICVNDDVCYKLIDMNPQANTAPALLIGMVLNFGRITDLLRSPTNFKGAADEISGIDPNKAIGTDKMRELLRLVLRVVYTLILLLAIFLPVIALGIAFLIRIPVLWLTIAFMPFMFVGLVLGEKMGQFNTMNLIWKKFLAAAFLPTIVAIPISAGFLLLKTGNLIFSSGTTLGATNESLREFMVIGIHNVLEFLWFAMTIAVLWIGSFTALSIDKIYERVAKSIQNWGQGMGKFIGSLPFRAPIIPFPTGGVSPMAVATLPQRMRNIGSSVGIAEAIKQAFGGKGAEATPAAQNVEKNIRQEINVKKNDTLNSNISNTINELSSNKNFSDPNFAEQISKNMKNENTDKFNENMNILKRAIKDYGKEDAITLSNIQAAARAAGITLSDNENLKKSIEEWIRRNG